MNSQDREWIASSKVLNVINFYAKFSESKIAKLELQLKEIIFFFKKPSRSRPKKFRQWEKVIIPLAEKFIVVLTYPMKLNDPLIKSDKSSRQFFLRLKCDLNSDSELSNSDML